MANGAVGYSGSARRDGVGLGEVLSARGVASGPAALRVVGGRTRGVARRGASRVSGRRSSRVAGRRSGRIARGGASWVTRGRSGRVSGGRSGRVAGGRSSRVAGR